MRVIGLLDHYHKEARLGLGLGGEGANHAGANHVGASLCTELHRRTSTTSTPIKHQHFLYLEDDYSI